jgi:hypothetical protein
MSSSTDTADTATAETDIYTYQFESALDPTVSDFFVNNTLPTWTWDNFESDYLEEEPKAAHNTVLQAYKDNMKKIIDNKDLKQEIKRKTGQIFRDSMVSLLQLQPWTMKIESNTLPFV